MKLSGAAVDRFLDGPDASVAAVLIYGPDKGLVAERCKRLGRSIVDDLSDPFSVVELTNASLKDDGARLGDEARAMSFGGGKRLVRLRDASDSASATVKAYLDDPAEDSMIIVDAHELGPRSSLRKLFEGHDRAAALACYAAEGRDLARSISEILTEYGVSADQDAVSMLTGSLGSDRALVRQELQKLALFVGDGGKASADDVASCLVDSGAVSLDQLAFAVGDGKSAAADAFLQKTVAEGVSEVAILRALQRHFQRLELVVSQSENGKSVSGAVAGLRPPVFFKYKERFERQARIWSGKGLQHALAVLTDAEVACKSTGTPVALVCGRAVLAVSRRS
jgi:DNA polymerase III subunit delta